MGGNRSKCTYYSPEEKIGITVNGTEIFTDRKGIRLIAEAIIHVGAEDINNYNFRC